MEVIAPNGCIAYAWVTVDTASGRCSSFREAASSESKQELQKINEFRAYPNPFTDNITIEYNLPEHVSFATITITDAIGREVFESKITSKENKLTVYPVGMSPGVYICSVNLPDGTKKQYKLIYVQ